MAFRLLAAALAASTVRVRAAADDDNNNKTFPHVKWHLAQRQPFDDAQTYSTPFCVDLTGDDAKDCLVGSAMGNVEYWPNKGSSSSNFVFDDEPEVIDLFDVPQNAHPWCGDMDSDGDYDCMVSL